MSVSECEHGLRWTSKEANDNPSTLVLLTEASKRRVLVTNGVTNIAVPSTPGINPIGINAGIHTKTRIQNTETQSLKDKKKNVKRETAHMPFN